MQTGPQVVAEESSIRQCVGAMYYRNQCFPYPTYRGAANRVAVHSGGRLREECENRRSHVAENMQRNREFRSRDDDDRRWPSRCRVSTDSSDPNVLPSVSVIESTHALVLCSPRAEQVLPVRTGPLTSFRRTEPTAHTHSSCP